jgi:rhamnosyltransferase
MNDAKPHVLVMMSTYNGHQFLTEQINSILNQKNVDIHINIRDDGSGDDTLLLLRRFEKEHPEITVFSGDNLGYIQSFWTLLDSADADYDYYCFSDQDDVWLPDKLSYGISGIAQFTDTPALFASGLNVCDENLNLQYTNTFPKIKTEFGSAITRPRLSGCTMIFNRQLMRLSLKLPLLKGRPCMAHDTAIYLTALACGGTVVYSKESHIMFRRHSSAVTSHGKSILTRVKTVTDIFTTRKNEASRQAAFLYRYLSHDMTDEASAHCKKILTYRKAFGRTLRLCLDKDIYCGLYSVDFVTFFAVLFHKY